MGYLTINSIKNMNKLIVILSMVSILLAIPSTIKASADDIKISAEAVNGYQYPFRSGVLLTASITNSQNSSHIMWQKLKEGGNVNVESDWDTLIFQIATYVGDNEFEFVDGSPWTGQQTYRAKLFDLNDSLTNISNNTDVVWNGYISTRGVWYWPNPLLPNETLKISHIVQGDRILGRDLASRIVLDFQVESNPPDGVLELEVPRNFGRRSWLIIDCLCKYKRSGRLYLSPQN